MEIRVARCLSVVLAVVATLGVATAAPAVAAAPSGRAIGQQFFVDCSRAVNGNGSLLRPFNKLASVNALTLTEGDQVLLQRGATCYGTLAPQGNGATGRPIVIGAYGVRARGLPAIVGLTTGTSAVTLMNMSHVVIQDLALQTPFSSPTTTIDRQGLFVTATTGVVRDIVAQRLNISNVVGNPRNQANFAGGIIFSATNPSGAFDGITIQDNSVHDLSNNGITVSGRKVARPPADQPWPGATAKNILVTHNIVSRVTGNGIIVLRADAPTSSWNEVDEAAMANRDWDDPVNRVCNVGLWFWDSNNAVAEYNYVHNTVFKGANADHTGCDGEAFDMGDSAGDNTLYQYNVSRDDVNAILVVASSNTNTGEQHRGTFRYNLSIDDKSIMGLAPGCYPQVPTPDTCNGNAIRIYNNTYVSAAPTTQLEDDVTLSQQTEPFFGSLEFKNNIVYATGPVPDDNYFHCGNDCSNNLFFGMPTYGTAAVEGDPRFVDAGAEGTGPNIARAYKIRPGSAAACAGVTIAPLPIPNAIATSDFFGRRVQDPPSIGFAEGPCIGHGHVRDGASP